MFLTWFLVVGTSISISGCTTSQENSTKSCVIVAKTVLKKSLKISLKNDNNNKKKNKEKKKKKRPDQVRNCVQINYDRAGSIPEKH